MNPGLAKKGGQGRAGGKPADALRGMVHRAERRELADGIGRELVGKSVGSPVERGIGDALRPLPLTKWESGSGAQAGLLGNG
jgi:hypothetical protein